MLTNFVTHRVALSVHAVSTSVTLLVGPWQLLGALRVRRLGLHRMLGRIYAGAVLIGWIFSIPVGLHAETGGVASAGFLTLGVCWIAATIAGVIYAVRGESAPHRRWMVRRYALTCAAITLRLYLVISGVSGLPFAISYPAIAWSAECRTSWVRNGGCDGAAERRPNNALPSRCPATRSRDP